MTSSARPPSAERCVTTWSRDIASGETLDAVLADAGLAASDRAERKSDAAGYGLILGGALGNVVDRVRLGGVTDFLDFYVGATHWPTFNLADTAIFCGVVVLLFWRLREGRSRTGAV